MKDNDLTAKTNNMTEYRVLLSNIPVALVLRIHTFISESHNQLKTYTHTLYNNTSDRPDYTERGVSWVIGALYLVREVSIVREYTL